MFACIFTPDFPVQAVVRLEPESTQAQWKQLPIAILEGPASLQRVVATNAAARWAGIAAGMTKLQAETCGQAVLRKRSIEMEDAAQAALMDCAYSFSPRVESTASGTVIADLAGTQKLFGSAEEAAQKIAARSSEFGFDANIAIAGDPDTAFYAARGFTGTTLIPAGHEAKRLSSLSVDVLLTTPEILDVLKAWGIRNFGALAALPSIALVERLGQEGLQLQKLARGEVRRVLVPAGLSQDFIEHFEFDDPVETLESLTFILNRLLHQLCSRLICRALATNELHLRLELEVLQLPADREKASQAKGSQPKECYERQWKLPLPVQDARVLFRLASLDLQSNTQSAPIKKIFLQAMPVSPRCAQGGLFSPAAPEPEQLEITLARIRSVVGATDDKGIACVGSPRVLNSHQPDGFSVDPFSTLAEELDSDSEAAPVIAMRMFRPPWPATVEVQEEKPCSVILQSKALKKKRLQVLAASGPWRGSGHWWSESSAWARDEWDVALKTAEGVGYYRIFQDQIRGEWFVQGKID
jgi:protein ImuB